MMKSGHNTQAAAAPAEDIGWRHFPEFEKLLTSEAPPALLAKIEKTCRQLNEVVQSGSTEDRERAEQAMRAYGRSLDLLHLLTEMRDKAVQQGSK
jgi:hypothetical protein